jgi:hypothetical protein
LCRHAKENSANVNPPRRLQTKESFASRKSTALQERKKQKGETFGENQVLVGGGGRGRSESGRRDRSRSNPNQFFVFGFTDADLAGSALVFQQPQGSAKKD